jgi:hypothetical protein
MAVWVYKGLLLPQCLFTHHNESRQPFIFFPVFIILFLLEDFMLCDDFLIIDLLVKNSLKDQATIPF